MEKKTYQLIALLLQAIENCESSGNTEWIPTHEARLADIAANRLPRGSGINNGVSVSEKSTPQRIVLNFGYHHMNEHGFYDGWSDYEAIVTPCLIDGFNLRVKGDNRNDILDYLHEIIYFALKTTANT